MGKLSFLSLGAVLGSLLILACVGDSPTIAPSGTATQGELNGPCFANGTCNAGLSCSVVKGAAQCVGPDDASSPADASTSIDDAATAHDSATSGGPPVCSFQTTTFPCGGQMPPNACYGATQSCTLTGCGVGDLLWQCFSPRQCSNTPCCVAATTANFIPGANCAQGTLVMADNAPSGASCSSTATCPGRDTQLCQANSDCPTGQRCTPVKIAGGGAAMGGNVIVAACTP